MINGQEIGYKPELNYRARDNAWKLGNWIFNLRKHESNWRQSTEGLKGFSTFLRSKLAGHGEHTLPCEYRATLFLSTYTKNAYDTASSWLRPQKDLLVRPRSYDVGRCRRSFPQHISKVLGRLTTCQENAASANERYTAVSQSTVTRFKTTEIR